MRVIVCGGNGSGKSTLRTAGPWRGSGACGVPLSGWTARGRSRTTSRWCPGCKYCIILQDGVPTRIDYGEIDHCCRNFVLVGRWLDERGLQRVGRVGHASARLARSRDVVATVVEELAADPCRFLCPEGTGCEECDLAWKSTQ